MLCFTLARRTLILLATGLVFGLVNAPNLVADVDASKSRDLVPSDEQSAIQQGIGLKRSLEWVKAIKHYERCLKVWPDSDKLVRGLRESKVQFSIERRYSDKSFLEKMLPLSRPEALVYLDDAIEKVRHYYVDQIRTTSFIAHGTESLYFGLNNQKFQQKNLYSADANRVAEVRKTLLQNYWNKELSGSDGARQTVLELCDLCQRELGLAPSAVVMEFVFGGCNSLDDYSGYLTPGKLDDLYNNIDGEFVGIGIEMEAESGKGLMLLDVIPDSPASEGGAKPGDSIVEIDGKDCRNFSNEEAAALLQGQPFTRVKLTLLDPETGRERTANLTRRAVTVKSIPDAMIIDQTNHIGYIRMTGFQSNTAKELDAAMKKLQRQGMQALIWDLRENPGGLLNQAVEVLDRFMSDGVLVSTRGRQSDQNSIFAAHADANDWKGPLVLLVDDLSASASEIVAGAIHDHHRGTIVGRKTYGKWSVQSILKGDNVLPGHAPTGFRLTTAKFYSPNGQNYAKVGIEPDVKVGSPYDRTSGKRSKARGKIEGDRDVEAGLETLRKQLARR